MQAKCWQRVAGGGHLSQDTSPERGSSKPCRGSPSAQQTARRFTLFLVQQQLGLVRSYWDICTEVKEKGGCLLLFRLALILHWVEASG